ncbi:MAG: rRNA maturation RNase YbeY [Candidatus Pacebacteria bacterium]|nr:rRNA maturation RNase YbeY [Candidatus Paceibacterota bacterium]
MIEINNLTTNEVDNVFLEKIIDKVLKEELGNSEYEISLALIGEGRMRAINKRYRGKNKVTDVLSFSEKRTGREKFITHLKDTSGLGEIVICLREIKKKTRRDHSSYEEELARVLIHGVLHLLGYDHEKNEQEAEKMREKEEYYLIKCKA